MSGKESWLAQVARAASPIRLGRHWAFQGLLKLVETGYPRTIICANPTSQTDPVSSKGKPREMEGDLGGLGGRARLRPTLRGP
ncbi:hypothetical protein CDL15_Pgr023833 [Punica granatum]|uniref:Uncharacterized protein n=1 Tax=Punica granatum TaxID=22663 RepID=A0A218VZ42_PUNGR|nr:hypothetical protein CDL15_Pgr023833 [Punica granatum]